MLRATELTAGERLLISRRRSEQTIADAAAYHATTEYRYRRWERDEEKGPDMRTGRLKFHEQSVIMRRRANASVAEFARLLDVSPWWLRQMETGEAPDDRLRDYWTAAGA
tara:strand:- start:9403 stop:9732 length:330 start_codon:yes stop_codon:yes gene_type:complete